MATLGTATMRVRIAAAAIAVGLLLATNPSSSAEPNVAATQARQAPLLDQALSALQPGDGAPHLYFVGFAGFGPEAVFKREVLAVRELFKERFGTGGRSVALINHASTADDVPLATAGNLERVLQHLGRIMDRERDTLFLFLTSHGERALLAVEMPGLELEHLTPGRLRGMLDRAGIGKRVVVVSACYSGSFIPALAGPNTLVIAAARGDRPSFGCSDKRQWTYFGDAFFNRALRRETSFKKAFHHASGLVRRWERRGGMRPSLPQMAGGEALGLEE